MPRQNQTLENLLLLGKIRKRGCSSPTSSSSSVLREGYRFKRAIVVAKRAAASPCGRKMGKEPVSARKLAETLWEMNEMPSPRVVEEVSVMKGSRKSRKERIAPLPPPRSFRSGSLPAHLSDPSHSPVSERMDRSGTRIRQRRESSNAQKLRLGDYNVGARDHISNGSFMDNETRSRAETPMGVKTRLKECSNALTTSKELLKIINRMWGQVDRSSSSMSLVSALHSELERARLQVNQLIHEHKPENNNDITYLLMKRFSEEKATWISNEQEVVEAAIESVAGELEAERKLRRRFESLNKKLGKELADTKAALMKAVKEVENEKRECFKVREEVEKEREMLRLADALREERVQMKLSEAKHQTYLKAKRCKEKKIAQLHNQESEEYLNHQEVEDEDEEDDLHSIELNVVENKSYKWPYGEDNNRGRKSTPSKSISLQRSISDWVEQSKKLQKGEDDGRELDWGRSIEGYLGDTQACKPNKASSKDHHLLSGPRLSNFRGGSVPMSRLLDAAEGENQSARRSRW